MFLQFLLEYISTTGIKIRLCVIYLKKTTKNSLIIIHKDKQKKPRLMSVFIYMLETRLPFLIDSVLLDELTKSFVFEAVH